MKVLIIDRDDINAQMIRAKLEPEGHEVTHEPSKDKALEAAQRESFDIVFVDPAPLKDARQIVTDLRRKVSAYTYIVVMSSGMMRADDIIQSGANDAMSKPLDGEALEEKIDNARFMAELVARMADDSEDFPSAGGVISKSAFNQLFLSALERADRYGEQANILFIGIANYREILELDGAYAADFAVAKLSQKLVQLRRQSDIIGQTAKHEYALLMQRPNKKNEAAEAADRFAESLGKGDEAFATGPAEVEIDIILMALPSGARLVSHSIKLEK